MAVIIERQFVSQGKLSEKNKEREIQRKIVRGSGEQKGKRERAREQALSVGMYVKIWQLATISWRNCVLRMIDEDMSMTCTFLRNDTIKTKKYSV